MAKPEKVQAVQEIAEKLKQSQGVVFVDYRGLNVKAMTELRAKLREAGAELKVVKNTLTRRAAEAIELEGLDPYLEGPTAAAFGYDDPVAPAKVLSDFAKTHEALELKAGVLSGKVIGAEEVAALARLPSKEELIGQVLRGLQSPIAGLANVLNGPIRSLVYVLEAIRKEKESAA